jgi:hypothetical protein
MRTTDRAVSRHQRPPAPLRRGSSRAPDRALRGKTWRRRRHNPDARPRQYS